MPARRGVGVEGGDEVGGGLCFGGDGPQRRGAGAQHPHRRLAGTVDQLPTNWLFPARRADQHITPTALGDRLRRLGIEPRTTRLAALTQLASEIPPAILANAIGINARTATQWVTTSGGSWSTYAS